MTAHVDVPAPSETAHGYPGERSGTILGVFAGIAGSGAILFFWLLGAIGLLNGSGGTIVHLQLEGFWSTAFLAYPFLFFASLLAGGVLAALKRDLEAVGVFGLPVVAAVVYYLALVHVRPLL